MHLFFGLGKIEMIWLCLFAKNIKTRELILNRIYKFENDNENSFT